MQGAILRAFVYNFAFSFFPADNVFANSIFFGQVEHVCCPLRNEAGRGGEGRSGISDFASVQVERRREKCTHLPLSAPR